LNLQKKVILSTAITANKIISLSEMDSLLRFDKYKAKIAYIQALTLIQYFVKEHGENKLRELLKNLKLFSIDESFYKTVNYDLIDFEINWYNYIKKNYNWLFILNLDYFLWLFLVILFIIAVLVIKKRNKVTIKKWELEENEQ
jgi:hypothetical protein